MKNIAFIFFLFFSITSLQAQNFDSLITVINDLRIKTLEAESDRDKLVLNDSVVDAVTQLLDDPNTLELSFPLEFMGNIVGPDNNFRMLNWNIVLADDRYEYYAVIQKRTKKGEVETTVLTDKSSEYPKEEVEKLNMFSDNWYGAIYYDIMPVKIKKQEYYLLLGWDGFGPSTTRKVLEVMYFDKDNEVHFGAEIFPNLLYQKRIIWEFKGDASMTLFVEDETTVVFSKVEPLNPALKGVYTFYIPLTDFNAYEISKKGLLFVEDYNLIGHVDPKKFKQPE